MADHGGRDTVDIGHGERIPARVRVVAGAVVALLVATGFAVHRASRDHAEPRPDAAAPPPSASPHTTPPDRARETVPWRDLEPGHAVYRRGPDGAPVTPYDEVSATGSITGTVHPGDTLVFDAVLLAPGIVSLRPCPDYTIVFGGHRVTRQLNCAGVPFFASLVRSDGRVTAFRPVLPAGTLVAFRMAVVVPDDRGTRQVEWRLEGPQEPPGFSGTVQVR